MPSIAILLDPDQLANPDADLRYLLPDAICAHAGGSITADGYDYVGAPPFMLVYLATDDLAAGLAATLHIIEHERLLSNDLRQGCQVAVQRTAHTWELVYPPEQAGTLVNWDE